MTEFDLLCERLRSRLTSADDFQPIDHDVKQAAVALILRQHLGSAELLMIQRAIRRGDHWSGNLALPGGRRQVDDLCLLFTAIRETREEVGVDLAEGGEVLGHLETITTRNPLIPQVSVSS